MQETYRVINLQTAMIDSESRMIEGKSPEHAAEQVLGFPLARSGSKENLVARAYWQNTPVDTMNMVRLYRRTFGCSVSVSPPE